MAEIYTQLCANAGTLERPEHPIANASDRGYDMREGLFRMWAGSGFARLRVYVWADSFESAFEELVEWLDENAPGCLVSHEEAQAALEEWQEENDTYPDADGNFEDESVFEQVEQANDWTVIGHTTLKTGMHIRSDEWGGDEVETVSDEYDRVSLASTEAAQSHFLAQDRAQAIAECEEAFRAADAFALEYHYNVNAPGYADVKRHNALITLFCLGINGDESCP